MGTTSETSRPVGAVTKPKWRAIDLEAASRWLGSAGFPFLVVSYLALSGGGYDAVVRGEVGLVVWWVLLLGAAAGLLPRTGRFGRTEWAALGLFVAFTVWTALGAIWSDSFERTATEVARNATLLGIFVLALSLQDRSGLRRAMGAVGAAIALVGLLALLSRLQPAWFPEDVTAEFLPVIESRLNYPLNYWNGLAALMAIGVPLLLAVATTARLTLTRALAAAAVPILVLSAFLTLSRGGLAAMALATIALLALSPQRLGLLPTYGLAGVGSALLLTAALQRDAFVDEPTSAAASAQADEMLTMVIVVSLGVGLLAAAISLAEQNGLARAPAVGRRPALIVGACSAMAAVVVFVAAGGPDTASSEWDQFKNPRNSVQKSAAANRLTSANGSGRYQFWSAALDANATAPLVGIGPGTYEFWWAAEGSRASFVRDAHSLYLEVLAELGIVGLLLLAGALLLPVTHAIRQSRRGSLQERRLRAGAVAAMIAFLVAAAVDWAWELAVLPATLLLIIAATLASGRAESDSKAPSVGLTRRVAVAVAASVFLLVISFPLASLKSVRASQQAAADGRALSALNHARDAQALLPGAATPYLQEALILEQAGELAAASAAAKEAARREKTNWRTWLTVARIEGARGRIAPALDALRTARALNPRSALFETADSQPRGGKPEGG